MKVCGVEILHTQVNICLLTGENGLFDIPDCRTRMITVKNPHDTEELRKFQRTMAKLAEDYKVEKFAIRSRPTKGKFAGTAESFKLEAALQLISEVNVEVVDSQAVQTAVKKTMPKLDLKTIGLKKFQQSALETAFAALA
ncbi:DUF3010 family protein [Parasalinivibrio latis]|uniref:DUF3010 family protein n=1 Tax=Parasalinivibrio latis TaxID=2952610 RepID=UPI0030DE7D97